MKLRFASVTGVSFRSKLSTAISPPATVFKIEDQRVDWRHSQQTCLMQYCNWIVFIQCPINQSYWLWPTGALIIILLEDFSAFQKYCQFPRLITVACNHQCSVWVREDKITQFTRRQTGEDDEANVIMSKFIAHIRGWTFYYYYYFFLFFFFFFSDAFSLPGSPQSYLTTGQFSSMGDRDWELCVLVYVC